MNNIKRNRFLIVLLCLLVAAIAVSCVAVLVKNCEKGFWKEFIAPTFTTIEVKGDYSQKNVVLDGTLKKVDITVAATQTENKGNYKIVVETDSDVDILLTDNNGRQILLSRDEKNGAFFFDAKGISNIDGYTVIIDGGEQISGGIVSVAVEKCDCGAKPQNP